MLEEAAIVLEEEIFLVGGFVEEIKCEELRFSILGFSCGPPVWRRVGFSCGPFGGGAIVGQSLSPNKVSSRPCCRRKTSAKEVAQTLDLCLGQLRQHG